jgi:hypothetical protein
MYRTDPARSSAWCVGSLIISTKRIAGSSLMRVRVYGFTCSSSSRRYVVCAAMAALSVPRRFFGKTLEKPGGAGLRSASGQFAS